MKFTGLLTGLGLFKPLSKFGRAPYDESKDRFPGLYYAHFDAGRYLTLPEQFCNTLTGKDKTIYITNAAFDRCLQIYPRNEWKQLRRKVDNLPPMQEAAKYFIRRVIKSAQRTKVDQLGNITINKALTEGAGIDPETEVVIVGQTNRIEVWNKKQWKAVTDPANIEDKMLARDYGKLNQLPPHRDACAGTMKAALAARQA